MRLTNRMSLVLVGGVLSTLGFVGCRDSFKSCESTLSCPSEGDGDGDTGGGGGDGDGDGDTGGTGDGDVGGQGGAMGTGGDPDHPCENCGGSTPHCSTELECVGCRNDDDCTTDEEPVCDLDGGSVCVECVEDGDCGDAALPTCDTDDNVCFAGCETNEDCERFADTPVCDAGAGECVECLSRTDCDGDVCERATNSCVDGRVAGEVGVCGECEYDDDCEVGQLCVEQVFDNTVVGNFCTWTKEGRPATVDASCFSAGRPYAGQTADAVASIEGQTAVLCILRGTTCSAFLQHSQVVTGCDDETPASDSACGATGVDDGLCRENTGGDLLCTYPCGSDQDCSGTFTCVGAPDGYCSL